MRQAFFSVGATTWGARLRKSVHGHSTYPQRARHVRAPTGHESRATVNNARSALLTIDNILKILFAQGKWLFYNVLLFLLLIYVMLFS